MKSLKAWLAKRHTVRVFWALQAILLSSALVTRIMLTMSPLTHAQLQFVIVRSWFVIPLLNWLPVLLFMLLLYFITSQVVVSISLVSFAMLSMALVNQVKLTLRGDPLLHWHLPLFREALGVVRGLGWWTIGAMVLGTLVFLFLTVWLCHLFVSQRLPLRARVLGALACAAVMLLCNATLYSSRRLEQRLPVWGSFYNMADVHNSKGNLYEFVYTWNTSKTEKPDGYDEAALRGFIDDYAEEIPTVAEDIAKPNIIMIMGEAFSDLSRSEALSFDGYRDPLEHFSAMGAEGLEGHLVVPSRGGGTADTEFDVLTGRVTRYLRNAPYAYRLLTGPTQSVPSLLSAIGYDTLALHPGYPWFYNRQNVYEYLGFDTSIFEDSFPREAYLDTFISEEATYDMLLERLAQHEQASDAPLFTFCLTIQNHAAYHNRYLPDGVYNFTPNTDLTPNEMNILSNYFAGTIDADTQLKRLADYLQAQTEPYVVVYFGDHLPALDEALYDKLIPGADASEGSRLYETRLYAVPYIIWENDAARAQQILTRPVSGKTQSMSSNYLGAYLLELLGMDRLSPYFHYANELRAVLPIIMERHSYTPDGQDVRQADPAVRDMLSRFRCWAYYRAMNE